MVDKKICQYFMPRLQKQCSYRSKLGSNYCGRHELLGRQQIRQQAIQQEAIQRRVIQPVRQLSTVNVECQCCFDDVSETTGSVVYCIEKHHAFCSKCIIRTCENGLNGDGKLGIQCMDTSGCRSNFTNKNIEAILSPTLYKKYQDKLAQNDVLLADIDHLVTCPFCKFSVIIEDDRIKILYCQNEECGISSCILCKDKSHGNLTCEQAKPLDNNEARRIEEEQTRLVMRTCVKCKAGMIKIDGCNHLTCKCGAHQCYTCRQPLDKNLTHGRSIYGRGHFCDHNKQVHDAVGCKKCLRWHTPITEENLLVDNLERQRTQLLKVEPFFIVGKKQPLLPRPVQQRQPPIQQPVAQHRQHLQQPVVQQRQFRPMISFNNTIDLLTRTMANLGIK